MEQKQCKKCKRPLPDTYKHKLCENCRNKRAEAAKKGMRAVAGVAVFVGTGVIARVTGIHLNMKK